MSFLFPAWMFAAAVTAAGVIGLHFITPREPQPDIFPTARFLPSAPLRSARLALRLSDIAIMFLRALAVLLVGAALAHPRLVLHRAELAKVVAVDTSRVVKKDDTWRKLVRETTSNASVIITFDSITREVNADDLAAALGVESMTRGSLSTALIASLRAASRIREAADSIDLVVISPLSAEEIDAATLPIRRLWPGRISVVRTATPEPVERDTASSPAVIEWVNSARSSIWVQRSKTETIGGVRAGEATLVFPFERRWELAIPPGQDMRIIARWIDGEPAAVQRDTAGGTCLRSVAFSMPEIGDAVLRPDFVRFERELSAPCRDEADLTPLPPQVVSSLEGSGGPAPSSAIPPRIPMFAPSAPWLLLAACVCVLLELVLRRARRAARTAPPLLTSVDATAYGETL